MNRPSTAETVISNIKYLLDELKWNVPRLEKESGVPKRTIYSILNRERTPGIDTTDQIAKAFGLDGWHLLKPHLRYDIAKNGQLDKLIDAYENSSDATRGYVDSVLDRERKLGNGK
jgi:transcriptional regulator with XRE-family HTH domain